MLKDFLKELFGIVFHGVSFERILWVVLTVVGIVMGVRLWRAYKKSGEQTQDFSFRLVMSGLLTLAGLYFGAQAWFDPEYGRNLFFAQPLVLHTYGVCIAVGFVFAIWIATIEARRTLLDPARMLDLAFWVLIAGMVGSRIVFMMVEWESYYNRCFEPSLEGLSAPDCMALLRFWEGGLVFYGGLIGAGLVGIYYLRKHNMEVTRYVDAAVVGIPIGQFFGRLGCLSAGCCHGKYVPSERAIGIHWPDNTAAFDVILRDLGQGADRALFMAERFVSAHPTQLYESGASLMLFCVLLFVRTRKQFNGQIAIIYMMSYAVIRGVIEIFRGDKVRGFIFEYTNPAISEALGLPVGEPLLFSTSQFISVLMFTSGVVLWVVLSRRSGAKQETTSLV